FQKTLCAIANQSRRERAPRHRRNLFSEALVKRTVRESIEFREADFHLMDDQGPGKCLLQGSQQARAKIADGEKTNLACQAQLFKALYNIRRVGEKIRPVQHENIDHADAEPFERLLAGADNVFRGKIP